ncbi:hypothetical protein [Hymenobacter norwichensis]|uniref:hypothetical protein n=1 Tax=Hymenobacter norwichensis TaxID=223903 RepID=UPI0012F78D9F|nr:hypothetical protein [Hymenobacter norwichensis]
MKTCLCLLTGLLLLSGCTKEENAAPLLASGFNQPISLRHQQPVMLPTKEQAELTITLDSLIDERCPRDLRCFSPGVAATVLKVQEQNGTRQAVRLYLVGLTTPTQNDSATIQANNRRYRLIAHEVTPYPTQTQNASNKNRQLLFTVKRL